MSHGDGPRTGSRQDDRTDGHNNLGNGQHRPRTNYWLRILLDLEIKLPERADNISVEILAIIKPTG